MDGKQPVRMQLSKWIAVMMAKNLLLTIVRYIAALLVSLGLGGCSMADADLAGRYVCVYSYGAEMLVLRSDGSYTQLIDVDAPNGSVVHNGKWEHSPELNEVRLIDAISVDNNFGALRPEFRNPGSGIWVLKIEKRFGTVSLHWHPDFNYEFRRL